MVARKVVVRLKPNSLTEFTEIMECEIVPWLRKQEGFVGLTILPALRAAKSQQSASGITNGMCRHTTHAVIPKC